jgi:hypothetical protein
MVFIRRNGLRWKRLAFVLLAPTAVMPCSGAATAQSAPALHCGSAAFLCRDVPSSPAAEVGKSAVLAQDPLLDRVIIPDRRGVEENVVIDAPEPQLGADSSPRELQAQASSPTLMLQVENAGASGQRSKQDGVKPQDQNASRKHSTGQDEPSATSGSPGHIFWVIPAYKVNYSGQFQPLTPREKFQEWAQSEYDPLGLAATVVEAGTLEYSSTDGFCGYGSTFTNYMQCFGSLELDATDSSFLGDYVFTVWWHQDPRYFRLGKGSFGKRTLYAISRVFITYNDSGKNVFYSSGLAGTGIAAVLSNLYYPQSDRTVGHTFSRVGIDLGDTALYNGAAEFWPGIHRWVDRVFRQ